MDEYGPQTEEIKKFLERVRNLTPEQIEELGVVYDTARIAVPNAVYYAAHTSTNAAYDTVQIAAYDTVQIAAYDTVRIAVPDDVWKAVRDAVWSAAPDAVWDVIYDAVLALVVKDVISITDFNILYGPWKSAMEK